MSRTKDADLGRPGIDPNAYLPEIVAVQLEWASRHGISDVVRRVVHLTRSWHSSELLGAIPHFVYAPETVAILKNWAPESPDAALLLAMAAAHGRDPSHLNRIHLARPLHRQFRGVTRCDGLQLALAVRIPMRSEKSRDAMRHFQCWLLLAALRCEAQGAPLDSRVQRIATDLRLGLDDDTCGHYRLTRILHLLTPTDSLTAFEAHLGERVTLALGGLQDKGDQLYTENVWWKTFLHATRSLLDPESSARPTSGAQPNRKRSKWRW